jgi:gamma-glutamyl phosphate reductase
MEAKINEIADKSRVAARVLAITPRGKKDAALHAMADALLADQDKIIAANEIDVRKGQENGLTDGLIDRLTLDSKRIGKIADALRDLASLPDPVGEVLRGSTLENGLQLRQVSVPLGVVGMIYEARPNVTVDAAGLGVKSGNAVILRGGSAAAKSNAAIVQTLSKALQSAGLPGDAIQSIDHLGREGAVALMKARGKVDVLVPRGGAGLIQTVVREAAIPVIETGVGNCHVYVQKDANQDEALSIVLNAKTQRNSVCNAAETLLIDRDIAREFVPKVVRELTKAGVKIHGDEDTVKLAGEASIEAATEEDWATEYLGPEMALRVVDDLSAAITHITKWSTGHTEAICTTNLQAAQRFVAEVDSAAVIVNASTRFTDGAQFGLGAEIGISTQKLHARGPMGLAELTTTKWVVWGNGQVRS